MRVVCQELVTQNLLNQRLSLQRNIEFVKRKLEQALVRRAGEEEEERKVNAQAAAVLSRTRELQQVNADKMREVEKLRTANSSVLSQVHTHTHARTRTQTHTHEILHLKRLPPPPPPPPPPRKKYLHRG